MALGLAVLLCLYNLTAGPAADIMTGTVYYSGDPAVYAAQESFAKEEKPEVTSAGEDLCLAGGDDAARAAMEDFSLQAQTDVGFSEETEDPEGGEAVLDPVSEPADNTAVQEDPAGSGSSDDSANEEVQEECGQDGEGSGGLDQTDPDPGSSASPDTSSDVLFLTEDPGNGPDGEGSDSIADGIQEGTVQTEGAVLAGPVDLVTPPESSGQASTENTDSSQPASTSSVASLTEPDEKKKDAAESIESGDAGSDSSKNSQNVSVPADRASEVTEDPDRDGSKQDPLEESDLNKVPEAGYLYENSMSIRELSLLPMDEAGAATEISLAMIPAGRMLLKSAAVPEDLWSCSDYYVNEDDLHSVCKNSDFSLKYQIEFHTSTQIGQNGVQIRVPQALMNDRLGRGILPSQIGVPGGSPDSPCESLNSPFNWFLDEGTNELVFFNYREISSGTNTAFQVLYNPVRILEICDQSAWSITPVIFVSSQGMSLGERELDELTGSVDSHARIVSVSANAYSDGSISCMPALYTRGQVSRVLGMEVPAYLSEDDGWLFAVWQIDTQGDYDQPWDLRMDAALSASGITGDADLCTVGSITRVTGTAEGENGNKNIVKKYAPAQKGNCLVELSSSDLSPYMKQGQFHLSTIAVTAVRKDVLNNNQSVLVLDPAVTLTPKDGIDPASSDQTSASWTFVDYTWEYEGNIVGIGAWSGERYSENSVSYSFHEVDLPGWINEYELMAQEAVPAGPVPFRIMSECRGYDFTHDTEGPLAGNYRTGTGYEVTTADDTVYAISQSAAGENQAVRVLSGEDYYYTGVSVAIRDRGMDIFEDRKTDPMSEEECPGADRTTVIYAMYEGSSSWEEAATLPWSGSGKVFYTFTREQLNRKPWRVKTVHNAVDYESSCTIDCDVCIRPDSPVVTQLLAQSGDQTATLRLEHLGSVLSRSTGTANDGWFHDRDDSGSGNYSEPGLSELTRALYGEISMRANSFASLTRLKKHARALKTVSRENDPANGCIRLDYTIGALEGYLIYSQEAADRIAKGETNFPSPDRSEYVIYDLLPEGVIPDPSQPMKAGLVMGTQDKHLLTPSLWQGKNVSVHVDSDTGVIPNWKNTGRCMLILNVSIHMEKEKIARMCEGMWLNGVGVRFSAYCPYKDLKRMKNMPNIAALMPGIGRFDPACQILGSDDETSCDDGIVIPFSDEVKAEFQDFGADIDSDGVTNLRTVLYAYTSSEGDAAVSLTDGISLTVKADKDEFSTEGIRAVVGAGDPYTYRIDVTNSSSQPISDLVITDHLEIAALERSEAEHAREFDETVWQGFLEEVDTEAVKRLGISPVIYLSADRNAPLPGEGNPPESILTAENGWYILDEYEGEMAQVCSVAVDLRKKMDGSSFILDQGDSVHISLHMNSPLIGDEEGQTRAEHAYNCASFYSVSQDEPDADLVTGDAVEVTLMEQSVLIVEKKMKGQIPGGREDESYLFCLTRKEAPVAMCAYRLEIKSEDEAGDAVWMRDGILHITNRDGYFYLREGQRAVFENEAGGADIAVQEIRSAGVEVKMTEENTPEGRVLCFENSWHPTLYLTKKVYGSPGGMDLSQDAFRVKVTAGGNSLAGSQYWTIDPKGALIQDQVIAEHTVDEESCVMIHAGEVLALHPADAGCAVEAIEMGSEFGPDSDYVAVTAQKSQILGDERTDLVLENAWRWKDLILQKSVLHKESFSGEDVFTFCLWKMHDGTDPVSFDVQNPGSCADPAKGVEGMMEDQSFVTDEHGCFSLSCAGKDVVLKHLEAGKGYVIQETAMPEFYEAVNGGIASVIMPVLSERRSVSLVNSWKKRSLEVSKAVLSGEHVRSTAVCTPGYPGYVSLDSTEITLLDCSPAGMSSFSIEFPGEINLERNAAIVIQTEGGTAEHLTGTVAAGTVRSCFGSKAVVKLIGVQEYTQDGFFFSFTPAIGGSAPEGEDQSQKQFAFVLETEGEDGQMRTGSQIPYVLSTGESLFTDENGMFYLYSGTSALFLDLGVEGAKWKVTEMPDPECGQVYPDNAKPWTGKLGENDRDISQALFINGEECQGMIRKSFCAAQGDEAAQQWIAAERLSGSSSRLRAVFLIETEDENGSYVPMNKEIDVADAGQGKLFTCEVQNGYLCLSESQTAIISGLETGRGWRATEIAPGLVKEGDTVYLTECITPGEEKMISGSISDIMTCADFVNEIHSIPVAVQSLVCKDFVNSGSWEKVPEGAYLAFRLERFRDGSWKPAANVRWVQCLDQIPRAESLQQTGADGVIRVRRERDGSDAISRGVYILPVAIEGDRVNTELYYLQHEAIEGDMRIREAPDLSDPSYGMLADCEGLTFINENNLKELIVEKQTDIVTDLRFSMQITQQLADGTFPGKYLSYRICDSKTKEGKGNGRTDERGIFSICSGESVIFELPVGTNWTVTELSSGSWNLKSCTMDNDLAAPEEAQRGVSFGMNSIRRGVTLTSDMLSEQLKDPITGQLIDFSLSSVTIPHYIQQGEKIMEITEIGPNAFMGYSMTSVKISEGILKIADGSFSRCSYLMDVELPRSLESIGAQCFSYSKITSLEFWPNVKEAGDGIALMCRKLTDIVIHQKRESSPFATYQWYCRTTPNVEFIE